MQAGDFKAGPDAALVGLGEQANLAAMIIAHELRGRGLRVEVLPPDRKLKAALTIASRMNAAFAVIIGEDELARGTVQVRDLKNSTQREVARDAVVGELAAKRQPA